jgi:DNA-binding SARP family transcriptional activator
VQNDSRGVLAELDHIPPGSLNDVWQGIVGWFRSLSLMHLGDARGALIAADAALGHRGTLHRPLAEGSRLQALWYLGRPEEVRAAFPGAVERMADAGYRNFTALAAAQCAIVLAHLGEEEAASGLLTQARAAAATPDAPLVDTTLALADAALAVGTGDEARAAAVLDAILARQPLGQGHSAAPQQRCLALIYVLAPASRPAWDAADLGPAFVVGRDLARAVVAVRDGGRLPADAPALPAAGVAEAHLPGRWLAEVAVAAACAGRDDGWRVLGDAWASLRPAVAALADRPGGGPGRATARSVLRRLAVPPAGHLGLRLLGPIELDRDGLAVSAPDWRRERVRLLLAYLALHRNASREQVADDLWPALDAEAQSRNLRVTLTYLLRVLEPDRAPRAASYLVHQQADRLALRTGGALAIDVWEFDEAARRAADANEAGTPAVALDHALRAVELWRGEPTDLVSQPWALAPLEERRRRFAALATRAGELLLARGSAEGAQALAERALAVDPWLEAAHRLVVAANHALGDDLSARRALTRYRDAVREIGLDPDESTLMIERLLDKRDRRP